MNTEALQTSTTTAKIIYILLIISSIFGIVSITGIIALIMVYVVRDDSKNWLQTHYRFQIRTYWIGLLYVSIGVVFLNTLFSYIIFLFTFVWIIIRCTKGLKQLEKQEPVHNLESWLFT